MTAYIPNTGPQQEEMLKDIGFKDITELFNDIPDDVRLKRKLDLPGPLSEIELAGHMRQLASKNKDTDEYTCFLGAGAYDHFIPAAVGHILSRQEFYTAYTPYQPEISQGTLQAIFEYQTMVCELTGMEVSNASVYDGATALAEAAIMACRTTGRKEVIISKTVHPEYRIVLNTYARFNGFKVTEAGYIDGRTDISVLEAAVAPDTAAVIIQNPNFFGVIERMTDAVELAHKNKALFIACVDPISLGLLKPPGEYGADIVVGEGQSLGNNLSFGGPYLGFFATTGELMRKMPGRVVGETADAAGKRGFLLTMQAREQHIRREKATSNICSNQALNALAATVYLTLLGKQGLKEIAGLCLKKAHYANEELVKTGLFIPCFTAPFFKEFAVRSKIQVQELNKRLLDSKIIGGYELEKEYPELGNAWLPAFTEKRTKGEIDALVREAILYLEHRERNVCNYE